MPKAVFNAFAYPCEKYNDYLFNYQDVLLAIMNRMSFKTNHMYEMSSCWDYEEYDVYLVSEDGEEYLIDNETNLTPKDIRRPFHNIHKMWRSTSFCDNGRDFVYSQKIRDLKYVREKYGEKENKDV